MHIVRYALLAALLAAVAAPVHAAEETFDGSLVCAKCTLKRPDAKECQDVLVVTSAEGAKTEYYITKNDVARQAGEVCTQEVKATVTGTVSQKDGRNWLTASKIEKRGTAGEDHKGHAH